MSLSQSATVHGVFMNVFGTGTLILGKSGVGKSDLALSLIDRGHVLIADDIVEFSFGDGNRLWGQASTLLKNFLEIRGLGVFDIAALFGAEAVMERKELSLVVHLEKSDLSTREIVFNSQSWSLLGVAVPFVHLPLSEERPREVLLEVLVRNHQLIQKGCHTSMNFLKDHHKALSISA